jgi:hypothetical protein
LSWTHSWRHSPGEGLCELFEILTAFVKVHRLIAVIRAVRSSTRKETDSSPGEPGRTLVLGDSQVEASPRPRGCGSMLTLQCWQRTHVVELEACLIPICRSPTTSSPIGTETASNVCGALSRTGATSQPDTTSSPALPHRRLLGRRFRLLG